MSAALSLLKLMTVDEFLAWPGDGMHRLHQLIDGRPVPVSPASWVHSVIATRLANQLNLHFAATTPLCEAVVDPGVQPRAGATRNVRIPDVAVSCAPVTGHLMREPVFMAEVLSPSRAESLFPPERLLPPERGSEG